MWLSCPGLQMSIVAMPSQCKSLFFDKRRVSLHSRYLCCCAGVGWVLRPVLVVPDRHGPALQGEALPGCPGHLQEHAAEAAVRDQVPPGVRRPGPRILLQAGGHSDLLHRLKACTPKQALWAEFYFTIAGVEPWQDSFRGRSYYVGGGREWNGMKGEQKDADLNALVCTFYFVKVK